MRVLVAGASGAIGARLTPQFVGRGHQVVGTGGTGIYNIVDDEPAPVREWLPVLADALGAAPPRHAPRRLARLIAGEAGVMMGTQERGASNAKAKRDFGWTLKYPTWRQGFFSACRDKPHRRARVSAGRQDHALDDLSSAARSRR